MQHLSPARQLPDTRAPHRLTAGTPDQLRQKQYNNILRSLKEEHGLLKDLDNLLQDIRRPQAAPSRTTVRLSSTQQKKPQALYARAGCRS
jgi:hypothetical protein